MSQVRDACHVQEVINAGCKIISVRCVESIEEAENVLSLIASLAGDDVIRIVGVPAMQRGCEEVSAPLSLHCVSPFFAVCDQTHEWSNLPSRCCNVPSYTLQVQMQ